MKEPFFENLLSEFKVLTPYMNECPPESSIRVPGTAPRKHAQIGDEGVHSLSASPWWSQLIDATLYLRRKDGVLADGTKISSRI